MNEDIEQQAARRIIGALWVFWCLLALAAAVMLLGRPMGSLVVAAAALVAGIVFFGFLWRSRSIYDWAREQSRRWLAFLVQSTGWNTKLVGVLLAIPLVALVGILVWLTIAGGPDFGNTVAHGPVHLLVR